MKTCVWELSVEAISVAAFVAAPLLILAMIVIDLLGGGEEWATIWVKGMCCESVSRVAEREVRSACNISDFKPDFRTQTVTVSLRGTRSPALLVIWEAFERSSLQPQRITHRRQKYDASYFVDCRS